MSCLRTCVIFFNHSMSHFIQKAGAVSCSSSPLDSGSFLVDGDGLAHGAVVPTPGGGAGKRVPSDGGPRAGVAFDGGDRVGIPPPLDLAFAHGAFIAGIPGGPDCPVQLVAGCGNEAPGIGTVRCVDPESHGAFVPAISPAICGGRLVDVGADDEGFGADMSLAP